MKQPSVFALVEIVERGTTKRSDDTRHCITVTNDEDRFPVGDGTYRSRHIGEMRVHIASHLGHGDFDSKCRGGGRGGLQCAVELRR